MTLKPHNRAAPGSDLLPFLFVLWRGNSRQGVQERQLENTATARQGGRGRMLLRCEAGRSFQGVEGNRRWGRRCGGGRGGGGAVLPVKPASPFPTRVNVSEINCEKWAYTVLMALSPAVWGSLNMVAATGAGPRAVCGPYPFHLSARLTHAQLLHISFRKPEGRFNLPDKEIKKSQTYYILTIPNCCPLS